MRRALYTSLLATGLVCSLTVPAAHGQSTELSSLSSNPVDGLSSAYDLTRGLTDSLSSGGLSSVVGETLSSQDMNSSDGLKRLQELWSTNQQSSEAALLSVFALTAIVGGSSMVQQAFELPPANWPLPIDESIDSVELIEIQDSPYPDTERWIISSPANARLMAVDIYAPGDSTEPRPMIYMYEGVDGPDPSHWLRNGKVEEVFQNENVYVIMNARDVGHFYTDWRHDDPVLGRNKIDTFYTQELPQLLESRLNFNGKRAAIGLSMGASGAVMTANRHPGFYDAVGAFSGCYSTLDPIGRNTVNLTVRSRGGDTANMWNEEDWARNDVTSNPENLRGTTLFFGAANGVIDPEIGRTTYENIGFFDQVNGSLLEAGAYRCTLDMQASLENAGIPATFDYRDFGAHSWATFQEFLAPAWVVLKPALF